MLLFLNEALPIVGQVVHDGDHGVELAWAQLQTNGRNSALSSGIVIPTDTHARNSKQQTANAVSHTFQQMLVLLQTGRSNICIVGRSNIAFQNVAHKQQGYCNTTLCRNHRHQTKAGHHHQVMKNPNSKSKTKDS